MTITIASVYTKQLKIINKMKSRIKNALFDGVLFVLRTFAPSSLYLKFIFPRILGYKLDLDNPKTFNEKIQWIKLNDRNPLYTICADKYKVRAFVEEKIGVQYLINLLKVYNNPKEIDFSELPSQFAIKLNTGSSCNIICKDKYQLDENEVRTQFQKWMKDNSFFKRYKEIHYKGIEKKIICEELLKNTDGTPLFDYKFYCFNGEPYIIMVELGSEYSMHRNIYNIDWSRHPGYITNPQDEYEVKKPEKLDEMIDLARKLSHGFKEVRVDFYYVNNNIYFGELTFTSGAGFSKFSSYEFDLELGQQFELSK